ncbi:fimbrial protein [Erwinia sp. P6884]|uniref:fimbrial protein n=1 Tax=Erwinia sp. P6884 TaxID=3141450 RepID=UPI0031976EBF
MDSEASSLPEKRSGQVSHRSSSGRLACLLLTCFISALPAAQAKEFSQVDGETGILHITGALTQGACRLEMQSAYQQIELGNLITGDFTSVGARGTAVPFQLILSDCLMNGGLQRDAITNSSVWDNRQPVASVSFLAPADSETPDLVRIDGAQGLGLRLLDSRKHDVRLGNRSEPLFVAPYHDVLTWYVVPERTSAPLVAGAFTATVNFRLNYD